MEGHLPGGWVGGTNWRLEEARDPWEWECSIFWEETLLKDVLIGAGL